MNLTDTLLSAAVGAGAALFTNFAKKFFDTSVGRAARREQQLDADLARAEAVIISIREAAGIYWTAAGNENGQDKRQAQLIGQLTFLAYLFEELSKGQKTEVPIEQIELSNFHEACTGGDFGVVVRAPQPERCMEIEVTGYQLQFSAMRLRRSITRWAY